ncbi:MAG: hypothetical protein A2148_10730 [Chloroflexi bacterium RBG_16_68_14]|nr:MAG: hypothetical protein A2148_10730 [Chloroflexi bacterium RBG_16_68_14]
MLVVDGSGSIFARDFATMKDFSMNLAGSFVISPAGGHVGVVQFSGQGQGRLEIGLSSDGAAVKAAIDGMQQIEGYTDIQEGLALAQAEIDAHGRQGVPRIVILLTDGQQEGAEGDPVGEAEQARAQGTEIFAIGVGGGPNLDQLNAIASDPDARHVYLVENFDSLAAILAELVGDACPVPTTQPTAPVSSPEPIDTPVPEPDTPTPPSGGKDDPATCDDISFGVLVTDVISPAGDWDYYCFFGGGGQTVVVDIDASEAGSTLDPVLTLLTGDGSVILAENDDYGGLDSYLEYALLSSGTYLLRVESYDHPCCGGPAYTYTLVVVKLGGGLPPVSTPTPTSTPTPWFIPIPRSLLGDVNCDGRVNSIDAALILQFAAGLIDELPCPEKDDVNVDGTINSIDATLILQYDSGLIDSLPP